MRHRCPVSFALHHSNEQIVEELRRVAAEVEGPLTIGEFERRGRMSVATVQRRFGTWRSALVTAGLRDRYSGRPVVRRWKRSPAQTMTDAQLLRELRRVAKLTGTGNVRVEDFRDLDTVLNANLLIARFGSMREARAAAGLPPLHGSRWTEEELLDNLITVWNHLGGPPRRLDLLCPPSRVHPETYSNRFGTLADAMSAAAARRRRRRRTEN